ncbi:MAG: hypothetical protein VYA17_14410 [Pseudomonadota bacterium]|nr:hypothetical protein [Pseudomonadota bacterium]
MPKDLARYGAARRALQMPYLSHDELAMKVDRAYGGLVQKPVYGPAGGLVLEHLGLSVVGVMVKHDRGLIAPEIYGDD